MLLSDIHLSAETPDITRRFLHFLDNQAQDAESLYILGDLFELWIGDDAPGEIGLQIAQALLSLSKQGKSLYFMPGNRDFLLGKVYADKAGLHLLQDPFILHCHNQSILLSHGDAWCTDDIEYQAFRHHRLQAANQQQFLAQSVNDRLLFAKNARDASQQHLQNSAAAIMDVNDEAVLAAFNEYPINTIIHGHTHRPADHHYADNKQRLVLGDWYQQDSWLQIDIDGIHRHGSNLQSH